KPEAALKAYRRALELALTTGLDRSAVPAFDEDAKVRRYALPGEELIGPVVRDLANHADWPFARWSEALPASPVAALAAYGVLREKGSGDAERALGRVLAEAPGEEPGPIDLAARAEALAFQARWAEAEATYREAIERMPVDLVRRSWWLNVASLAL